jgi:hypothetical protein
MATLDYRFRIRNDDNSVDLLTFSTIPGADCFLLKAPSAGDGQSFDPVLGSFVLGTYTVQVVDAGASAESTDGGAVSAFMADVDNRYAIISHVGIVEFSADDGATWTVYLSGYITRIRKLSALVYEFSVGDSQRVEQAITLFKEKSKSFDKMSCLIGGPVIGGFAGVDDFGPWEMEVKGNYSDLVTQFHFVSGFVRSSVSLFGVGLPSGGYEAAPAGDYTDYEEAKVNALAEPYRVQVPDFLSVDVGSQYPRLEARITDMDDNLIGLFMVVNGRDPDETLHAILSGGDLCVYWGASTVENPNMPGVNFPAQLPLHTDIKIVVYALDVSPTTPVHLTGHPIDLHATAYTDALIPFDAASVTATKTAIGDSLVLALRPTQSVLMSEFANTLQGFFGYSVRQENGKRVFFPTRIRDAAAPTLTCTAADIHDPTAVIFDLDEKGIINQVTMSTERYALWAPEKYHNDEARPVDELVTTVDQVTIKNSDDTDDPEQSIYRVHEQKYTLQGTIFLDGAPLATKAFLLSMARGAGAVFDRRQRGAIVGEIRCIRGGPGGLEEAKLGDEIFVMIPWQQNANGIGGSRIVQITKRTESPVGPLFMLEDAGVAEQAGGE